MSRPSHCAITKRMISASRSSFSEESLSISCRSYVIQLTGSIRTQTDDARPLQFVLLGVAAADCGTEGNPLRARFFSAADVRSLSRNLTGIPLTNRASPPHTGSREKEISCVCLFLRANKINPTPFPYPHDAKNHLRTTVSGEARQLG